MLGMANPYAPQNRICYAFAMPFAIGLPSRRYARRVARPATGGAIR